VIFLNHPILAKAGDKFFKQPTKILQSSNDRKADGQYICFVIIFNTVVYKQDRKTFSTLNKRMTAK